MGDEVVGVPEPSGMRFDEVVRICPGHEMGDAGRKVCWGYSDRLQPIFILLGMSNDVEMFHSTGA